ncbi:DUF58 domain-containing protein [Maribacter algarum]|uniref:DUF58 domain-containing protein n=1 Tax=Maribacter algarum (ex Zhang et al. 2020) TaxID=2578118 RepID=A0A5S3PP96_9FLAO|nr:DUF58 domain-containing protein [Maribacter algarum]TMM56243.1 DUF58 domain-containing protein [Maribacter algarum]
MAETKTSEASKTLPIVRFFKELFLNNRFFYVMSGIIVLFILSFIYPALLEFAKLSCLIFLVVVIVDSLILFGTKKGIKANRILPEKFSNGDRNKVAIEITNGFSLKMSCLIIDELPFQFQQRDFNLNRDIPANSKESIYYEVVPKERGEYKFGELHLFVSSRIGFVMRKFSFDASQMVKTYPSFLQLKKYDLISLNQFNLQFGIKKIRRIGNSFEFEQIKDYVQGDNIKDINWKATAKRNQLMVNQFQDEKSQQVYSVIDKGRVMKMPFEGLSLLDYAINSALVISSVVVRRHDKAGVFSFSRKPENFVVAERRNAQMNLIQESLYNVNTDFSESDFGNLYSLIKRKVTTRSLLLLYTNFASLDAVNRQIGYLRAINKSHLLVVVFFKNTELEHLKNEEANTIQEIFDKTIAEKFSYDKKLIAAELNKYGIQTILTSPSNLTIDTINKYLEIKAKGLL